MNDLDEFAEVALATLLIWFLTYLERTISRPLTEKRTRRELRPGKWCAGSSLMCVAS